MTLDLTERPIYLVGAKLGSLAAVPASASVEMPQPDASSRVLWYRQPASVGWKRCRWATGGWGQWSSAARRKSGWLQRVHVLVRRTQRSA